MGFLDKLFGQAKADALPTTGGSAAAGPTPARATVAASKNDHLAQQAESPEWLLSVRHKMRTMDEAQAVQYLRMLPPGVLIKAMQCVEVVELIRRPGNMIDLTEAKELYPDVQHTLEGFLSLDADSEDIAKAMGKLERVSDVLAGA